MLEGAVDFMLDGVMHRLDARHHVVVPDGALHAFFATGDAPARMLIINAPDEMHVRFFTEPCRVVPDDTAGPEPLAGPPGIARVLAVGQSVGRRVPEPAGV